MNINGYGVQLAM